jgi:hypothetical protein
MMLAPTPIHCTNFAKVSEDLPEHLHPLLAADPRKKLDLLEEAQSRSEEQVEGVANALTVEWKPHLADGRLTDSQRLLLRQLVLSLHKASHVAVSRSPEALRESLNQSILGPSRPQVAAIALKPDQQAVGRSLVRAALAGRTADRAPHRLPPDAPHVPGYALLRVLGRGGFGVVYLACHSETHEFRAVKVGPLVDPERFQREVRLLRSISGEHLVRYHEHGELPGQFWIAMDYLGEYTLADLIRSRPKAEQALLLAEQVLRGLATLHPAGVVHRDLEPENAMVDESFRLELIDYGLAKVLPGSPAPQTVAGSGGLVGTPRYMSPEQVGDSGELTCGADLWAFGCVLLELLTGKPVFASNNVMALGYEIMTKKVHVEDAEIPPEVRPFLGRCLERDPRKRWPDAGPALIAFEQVAGEARRRLRRQRHRDGWAGVVEKRLLEQFATRHQGMQPADALISFLALARQEGIEELDEEQLGEVMTPIFAGQQRVAEAERSLERARQQLQQDVERVSSDESARHGEGSGGGGAVPATGRHQVREGVEDLLEELRRWEAGGTRDRIATTARAERRDPAPRESPAMTPAREDPGDPLIFDRRVGRVGDPSPRLAWLGSYRKRLLGPLAIVLMAGMILVYLLYR